MIYDPFSYEVQEDPYPVYRWLRDDAPLWHNEELGFWTLSRHADVLAASLDVLRFSSAKGTTLEFGISQPMLISMDPPDHTTMRRVVNRTFTPRSISSLEDFVRRITREFLEGAAMTGSLDAVGDLSAKVPIQVIGEMLGIPPEKREPLRVASDRLIHREPDQRAVGDDNFAAGAEIAQMLFEEIDRRRAEPSDDLIGDLVAAQVGDTGESLNDGQLVGFCILLAIAGNETVTKLLANLVLGLNDFPDQRRLLLRDRSLVASAVEEALRWEPPSQYQGRTLTEDTELYGEVIPAGDFILLLTGSGCRDEREYEDPERFVIERPRTRPLGFGYGAHLCLGAALARLETRVMLEELLEVAPDFVIDRSGIERAHSTNVRGLSALPIEFTPNEALQAAL